MLTATNLILSVPEQIVSYLYVLRGNETQLLLADKVRDPLHSLAWPDFKLTKTKPIQ